MRRRHRSEPNVPHSMTLWRIVLRICWEFRAERPYISFVCHWSMNHDEGFFHDLCTRCHKRISRSRTFRPTLEKRVLIRCSIRFSSHAVNLPMPAACARVNRIEFAMSGIASSVPLVRCLVQRLHSKWVVLFASETHPFFRVHLGLVTYVGGSELRTNENYTYSCMKHVDRINWRRALSDEEMRKCRLHFRH